MKKVLILGSSGFIGRNLAEYFKDKYELSAPARKELDMLDGDAVCRYIKPRAFDVVLNALDVRADISTPQGAALYTAQRLRMFENIARLGGYYGKMLYFGSGAEYGRSLPVVSIGEEEFGRVVPEDGYGFLMYTMQRLASARDNITNFRLFGIFGPYEAYERRFISNAICKALCGYPITIRQDVAFDYLHTDDLCGMVEYYIENPMKHRAYNAVSGRKYELSALAAMVKETVKADVGILIAKPGSGKEYTASNRLLKTEAEGLRIGDITGQIGRLVDFYKDLIHKVDRETLLYNN